MSADSWAVLLPQWGWQGLDAAKAVADQVAPVLGLTRIDAAVLVRKASGILAERLARDVASRLAGALAKAGIAASVADATEVDAMGSAVSIHSGECAEPRFRVQVGTRGTLEIEWKAIAMVSASLFREPERVVRKPAPAGRRVLPGFRTMLAAAGMGFRSALPAMRGRSAGRGADIKKYIPGDVGYVADIFVCQPPMILRVVSNAFNYGYLGARLLPASSHNFYLLLDDMLRLAPSTRVTPLTAEFLDGNPLLEIPAHSLDDFSRYNRWMYLTMTNDESTNDEGTSASQERQR